MSYDKPILQTSNPYKKTDSFNDKRTIYYGEVISIDDPTDGGRIKVKISDLDTRTINDDLPWCYPLLPKFFHLYPQKGEVVRIFIEDIRYPQKSRFWLGNVVSQLHKVEYDSLYTALSTTNVGLVSPDKAPSTYPDADGVFPLKTDVAIVGKVNTDVILRLNEVHIRAGKHENDNILKLNTKNPAEISLAYEKLEKSNDYYSNTVVLSDKIALISHTGNPQFKAAKLTNIDRKKIFDEGHPMARADVLVEALNVFRNALITHIHGYSGIAADKTEIIKSLEDLNLNEIMQKNIVIN
jgi:hypothetical protein